jgi:transposase
MPWTEVSIMDERLCFIAACLRAEEPMGVLCARYGISRKTGYKWLDRYEEVGAAGLLDRSRARRTQSQAIDVETAARVVALRARRPGWGPRKLLARLALDEPDWAWPAASTVGDLLRREGLTRRRGRLEREPGVKQPLVEPLAANEVWSADFKGWFRTGDGVRCEPLTVADGYSRYLLACEPVPRLSVTEVRAILTRLFQEHGLPRALRTDNGSPFAHRSGLAGLTELSVWLLMLDIWPDRIAPGRPDQNGRHERMHRTLAEEVTRPPSASLSAQTERMEAWRRDFNMQRPHEALGQRCPATLWQPSSRRYPEKLRAWDYPADHFVRRVNVKGYIVWRDQPLYLTEALRGQTVGLARHDNGDWWVRFRGFDLAVLHEQSNVLRRSGLARTVTEPMHDARSASA